MAGPTWAGAGGTVSPRPSRKCPICGKPSEAAFYPFNSKRCADIDLNRWLSGVYSIPGAAGEAEDPQGDRGGE